MSLDPRIKQSFNNIKNRIYKNDQAVERYDFNEIAEILSQEKWNEEETQSLKIFKRYIFGMKESVEDLGSKVLEAQKIDFKNKIRVEEFIKEIIIIIDTFIDSLSAITEIIDFEESRINVTMSIARIKSLRLSIIEKTNEYNRMTSGVDLTEDKAEFIRLMVIDIIDSMVKESFKLQISKISSVLDRKL